MDSAGFALESCIDQVRRDDHDRYLTVLHARPDDRSGLFALYAFNIEIAKTREVISEPALGEIRLQWWRETIDGIFDGQPRQHDVALSLAALVERTPLPRQTFLDMIAARGSDLYDEQPETIEDLQVYARDTAGMLQGLAARSVGADNKGVEAAQRVGMAWALTGLLRAVPHHLREGRVYLPRKLMAEAGLTDPTRPDVEQTVALATVLKQITILARTHIAEARALTLPKNSSLNAVLRLAPLAEGYLRGLERAGFDLDAYSDDRGALGRQLRLIWAGCRGAY